jgi:enoyl-CoA hydratase
MSDRGRFVHADRDGSVLHVRLDRPDRLNAVSDELYHDLDVAFSAADEPEVRAVLLTGEGRSFCAGADLKNHASRDRTAAEQRAYVWAGHRACRRLATLPKPVVVAVQGHAIGAGAELALSADLLVVADNASFRLPEVGLGTFVGGGITHRLPLLVGQLRAKQLLLLGRPFEAEEANAWGLAAEVVAPSELLPRALALAHELAALPEVSARFAKLGLNRGPEHTLDDALVYEAEALLACMGSSDWSSGIEAFAGRGGEASP